MYLRNTKMKDERTSDVVVSGFGVVLLCSVSDFRFELESFFTGLFLH